MRLFFSAANGAFEVPAVAALDNALRSGGCDVVRQAHFVDSAVDTIEKLDDELSECDAMIHILTEHLGSVADSVAVDSFFHNRFPEGGFLAGRPNCDAVRPLLGDCKDLTYTQWEAFLAVHRGIPLFVFVDENLPDDSPQQAHLERLRVARQYSTPFTNQQDLILGVQQVLLRHIQATQPDQSLPEFFQRKPNNLPFRSIGTLFKGREKFLALMREKLATGKAQAVGVLSAQAIHGLGGVGKTRAVVEYAWRHQEEFSAVLFVTADSPESLQRNLAELVGPLVLDIKEAQQTPDQGARVAAAIQWLQAHKGWFLILDNVDNREIAAEVEKLVGGLTQGQIVVTSRLSKWSAAVEPLQLDVLAPEDGRDFLLERTERHRTKLPEDAQLALDIAHNVDGLALALEQAGAYIGELEISLAEYRQRWESKREQVLVWHDEQLMQYPKSLATTWEVSFDELTPAGRTLLEHLAWFAPELIPEFVFEEDDPTAKWEELLGGEDVRMVLADLRRYSLLRHEQAPEATGFLVHRLVQEITRRRIPEADKLSRLQGTLDVINFCCLNDPPPDDVRSWPRWEPLDPHVETILTAADTTEITNPTSRLMNEYGLFLTARVRYGEAERWYRRALAIDEASFGPDHSYVAIRLNNLALLLRDTNRLDEAEPLFRRALAINEASFGPAHPEVARNLNNLAQLLQDTNRLDEAEPLFRQALDIDEASFGPDHPRVASDLNNLAWLLKATNRLGEAEPFMRRALMIDEASFGPDHPTVAIRLNNLAQLLQATNRLGEAEPFMRRALNIDEASFGPDHPNVARDLNNLASLLLATTRLDEAEPLYRRALAIDEASFGPDHPNVANRLNNLASLLQATNRLDEAEPLMRRALDIFATSLGQEHPHTKTVQRNYDRLLAELQKR
ncbi:MAG: tetratricopeptide repeat protein [Planctomycetaceae bacterium]|nr:tetratricopeptide repeat protein [Planctomycetaceae bacterium]